MKSASKECPKCQSPFVAEFPYIGVGVGNSDDSVTANGLTLKLYTCGDCGFCETYLRTPVRSWNRSPEERGYDFVWHRKPEPGDDPYR